MPKVPSSLSPTSMVPLTHPTAVSQIVSHAYIVCDGMPHALGCWVVWGAGNGMVKSVRSAYSQVGTVDRHAAGDRCRHALSAYGSLFTCRVPRYPRCF